MTSRADADGATGAGMTDSQGFLDFDGAHVNRFIDGFAAEHVVCIGDIMLDSFVYGDAKRISPEAPVPVLRFSREVKALGGAGNVVQNIAALGAEVTCVGVVGDDAIAAEVRALLASEARITSALVEVAGRPTTSKIRYLAGSQQVVRVDREEVGSLSAALEDRVIAAFAASLRDNSVVVVADYAKGVLSDRVLQDVIGLARDRGHVIVAEPKSTNFRRYARASVLVANSSEVAAATGLRCVSDEEANLATREALRIGGFDSVVTTRSEKGMVALDGEGVLHSFPTHAREVFDVSGAGDTVNAVVALMLGAGATLAQSAYVANAAAGIVVSKLGTSVVAPAELKEMLAAGDGARFSDKILGLDEMAAKLRALQRARRKIGFTNGCFDILHTGHLSLLAQARSACDFLVVAVNSDASVSRLKGPGRPVNAEHNRALLLAALEVVDGVVVFDEDTPLQAIEALRPDVLVKGADYRREDVVGGDFVEGLGGQVVLANLVAGQSTTRIIERIGAKRENAGDRE